MKIRSALGNWQLLILQVRDQGPLLDAGVHVTGHACLAWTHLSHRVSAVL